MQHRDNQGNAGVLGPGSVQWMTAGRGIVHSEMPRQEDGLMWGFQLWVNLPARHKMTQPRYQEIPADQVPEAIIADGVTAKIIAGSVGGLTGPIEGVATDPVYLDVHMQAGTGAQFEIPAGHNAFVYVYGGQVASGDDEPVAVGTAEIALYGQGTGDTIGLAAMEDSRLLLIAGKPLDEPMVRHGPFVMNTMAELEQAFRDYHAGRI
jgi:quercetin 2,3-dioxygenase